GSITLVLGELTVLWLKETWLPNWIASGTASKAAVTTIATTTTVDSCRTRARSTRRPQNQRKATRQPTMTAVVASSSLSDQYCKMSQPPQASPHRTRWRFSRAAASVRSEERRVGK